MDPSSLIFVAIIAVWAAYLLGHWVRRRDQLATARSIDRFSLAMRVLERRAPVPLARPAARSYVVASARVAPAPPPAPQAAQVRAARPRPDRTSARTAAVRRRTLLLAVLILATAVGWPLVLLAGLPWWVAGTATVALLTLVGRLRSTARRQRQRAVVVRRRAVVRAGREDVRSVVGQVVASRQDRLARSGERAAAALLTEAVAPQEAQPVVAGGWVPVPVPPPTYTLKPKAPARRVSAATVPQPEPAAAPVTFDLDEILERRIASGA